MSKENTRLQNHLMYVTVQRIGGSGLKNGDPGLKRIRAEMVTMKELKNLKIPSNIHKLAGESNRAVVLPKSQELNRLLFLKFVEFGEGNEGDGSDIKKHRALVERIKVDKDIIESGVIVPKDWKTLMRRIDGSSDSNYTPPVYPKCAVANCEEEVRTMNDCNFNHITCKEHSSPCDGLDCNKSRCHNCKGPCEIYCNQVQTEYKRYVPRKRTRSEEDALNGTIRDSDGEEMFYIGTGGDGECVKIYTSDKALIERCSW